MRTQQLRLVFDSLDDSVVVLGARDEVIAINAAARRLTGFNSDEAVGRRGEEVLRLHRKGSTKAIGISELANSNDQPISLQLADREGREVPVSVRVVHAECEEGGSANSILFCRRRQVDDLVAGGHSSQQEFTEPVFETVREPLMVLDAELRVLHANMAFYRVFRVTAEETIGRFVYELGNNQWDIPKLRELLGEILGGQPVLEDYEVEHAFETIGRRTMLLNARKMFRHGNNAETILLAIEDVTQRTTARKVIESANRALQEQNEEMEQFAYVVSHDLKSPLVTLTGFLGMLRKQVAAGNSEKVEHYLQRLDLAAARMGELIEDLLNLSRVGRARGELELISLFEIARQAAEALEARRQQQRAKIHIQPDMPHVMADPRRLREVIQNLLENALKYGCPQPGGKVLVGARREDDEIQLFVRDDGPGIASEYQQRIFRLFERLDNKTEGTGVGLALVSRIAQVHNGRTWVESQPQRGATFYVALPIHQQGDVK